VCFFFQAEDGIRDRNVTGVQTCALPIWPVQVLDVAAEPPQEQHVEDQVPGGAGVVQEGVGQQAPDLAVQHLVDVEDEGVGEPARSEERRVGKEWRWRGTTEGENKRYGDG